MTPRASMVKDQFIFGSYREDFFKIFFATLIVFLLSFEAHFLSSTIVVLATVFLLDGGHVYSTLLEVYADPEELRKSYVWVVTIGSFFLNFLILYFFSNLFFYYIFYDQFRSVFCAERAPFYPPATPPPPHLRT